MAEENAASCLGSRTDCLGSAFLRLCLRRQKPNYTWQRAAPTMDQQPVSFPDWKEVPAGIPPSPTLQPAGGCEIIAFLPHGKMCRAPATAELARHHLLTREKATTAPAWKAWRWFHKKEKGRRRTRRSAGDGVIPSFRQGFDLLSLSLGRQAGWPAGQVTLRLLAIC